MGIHYEYVILTVAWRPLTNTFVQASGGMLATAKVIVAIWSPDHDRAVVRQLVRM